MLTVGVVEIARSIGRHPHYVWCLLHRDPTAPKPVGVATGRSHAFRYDAAAILAWKDARTAQLAERERLRAERRGR